MAEAEQPRTAVGQLMAAQLEQAEHLAGQAVLVDTNPYNTGKRRRSRRLRNYRTWARTIRKPEKNSASLPHQVLAARVRAADRQKGPEDSE